MKKLLISKEFDKVMGYLNYIVLSLNAIWSAINGNYISALGWGLAFMWCASYHFMKNRCDVARKGWEDTMNLLDKVIITTPQHPTHKL